MNQTHGATQILDDLGKGDASAAQKLLPLVYEELRAMAGSHFKRQRADHTLQPTALVHEAFVRLIDQTPRLGAEGKRIAFLHPSSTGGVLVELSER